MTDKQKYSNIPIPDSLDNVIQQSIHRGKRSKMVNQIRHVSYVLAACLALILVIQVPAVASVLEEIPIVGTLVRTFQFGEGGKRTDGLYTNPVADSDTLSMYFTADNRDVEVTPSYTIEKKVAPNRIVCTFTGVRNFDYEKLQEEANNIEGIKKLYRLVSLDDTVISFVIELDCNYNYSVSEYKQPGYMDITFTTGETTPYEVYYLRSNSMQQGENLSNVSDAYQEEGASIVQTQEGLYCMVVGEYRTREEAEAKLEELMKREDYKNVLADYNQVLRIEEGNSNENPR